MCPPEVKSRALPVMRKISMSEHTRERENLLGVACASARQLHLLSEDLLEVTRSCKNPC